MFDLIDPRRSGPSARSCAVGRQQRLGLDRIAERGARAVRLDRVDVRAATARASASASRMTRSCAGPLGAVRPLDAPSWLIALPRITASTAWPLRPRVGEALEHQHAGALGDSPAPSAPAPKALQRPSGARPRWRLNSTQQRRRRA